MSKVTEAHFDDPPPFRLDLTEEQIEALEAQRAKDPAGENFIIGYCARRPGGKGVRRWGLVCWSVPRSLFERALIGAKIMHSHQKKRAAKKKQTK